MMDLKCSVGLKCLILDNIIPLFMQLDHLKQILDIH